MPNTCRRSSSRLAAAFFRTRVRDGFESRKGGPKSLCSIRSKPHTQPNESRECRKGTLAGEYCYRYSTSFRTARTCGVCCRRRTAARYVWPTFGSPSPTSILVTAPESNGPLSVPSGRTVARGPRKPPILADAIGSSASRPFGGPTFSTWTITRAASDQSHSLMCSSTPS